MASTPRKKRQSLALIAARGVFSVGDRFTPSITARFMEYLWFRLPVSERRRKRATLPDGATEFTLETSSGRVWGYVQGEGPVVYLLHGWGGYAGDFSTIGNALAEAGYQAILVEAPSHGNSGSSSYGSRAASPLHFADALTAAIEKFGEPYAVAAHSFGSVPLVVTQRQHPSAQKIVLIAPFVGGTYFIEQLGKTLGVGPRTFSKLMERVERRVDTPMSYFEVPKPPLEAPTLIIHDKKDRFTPWEHGDTISKNWPNARLITTEGLGHMRILHDSGTSQAVVEFLKN